MGAVSDRSSQRANVIYDWGKDLPNSLYEEDQVIMNNFIDLVICIESISFREKWIWEYLRALA